MTDPANGLVAMGATGMVAGLGNVTVRAGKEDDDREEMRAFAPRSQLEGFERRSSPPVPSPESRSPTSTKIRKAPGIDRARERVLMDMDSRRGLDAGLTASFQLSTFHPIGPVRWVDVAHL